MHAWPRVQQRQPGGETAESGYRLSFAFDRYYMNADLAPLAEQRIAEAVRRNSETRPFLAVRVKNGIGVIEGLFVGDAPIERVITEQPASESASAAVDKRCVVMLHGKGQMAQNPRVAGDITYLRPGGNAEGWGGRQWLHFPDDRYREMRDMVAAEIQRAGCGQVIVQGFSSGAAAAAKLYCRGERFDGRVKGYIVDDPVPDHGVDNCTPPSDVQVSVYWTGGLSNATDGWSCATQDWTCDGGQTIGIEKYAQALRTDIRRSVHSTHAEYASPPEQTAWFAASKTPQ
jgi:pimeloyl-ACP methyl ester carboxylesterase